MFGLKEGISEVIKTVAAPILRLIPDPNARKEAEEQFNNNLLNALVGLVQGQLAINAKEAEHPSVWVAGWRPAIGWVCAAGFAWAFLLQPFAEFVVIVFDVLPENVELPKLDTGQLMSLALGMLGLGGLRTYEKQLGVARQMWRKKNAE